MRTVYFFLFFTVGCAMTSQGPPPVTVTTGVATATTSQAQHKASTALHEVIETPSVETLEKILEEVEKEVLVLSSNDTWTIEVILGVLHRADRMELGSLQEGAKLFSISVDRQDVFWNAALELAELLLAQRACGERREIFAIFFPLTLRRMEPWKQYVYVAALHFLITRHLSHIYSCVGTLQVAHE